MNPKEFIIAALDMDNKIFIVYIAIKNWEKIFVHLEK